MKLLQTKKYIYILGTITVTSIVLLAISFVFSPSSLLSLVISSEIRVLKQWQDHGGLQLDLNIGSRDAEVQLLQSYLRWSDGIYPDQDDMITGYYGEITATAVKKYQLIHGLVANGAVNAETREHINTVFLTLSCPESEDVLALDSASDTRKEGIPYGYVPQHLMAIDPAYTKGKIICLTNTTHEAFEALRMGAAEEGYILKVTSGYRHPEVQQLILNFWLRVQGKSAYDEVALPGYSEHQLGTTIDVTGESIAFASVSDDFNESPEWHWLMENAQEYGFVMSYPKGAEKETGYRYEPWHWRYVTTEDRAP